MTDDTLSPLISVITIDGGPIKNHPDWMRGTVDVERLQDAEADRLWNAQRYARGFCGRPRGPDGQSFARPAPGFHSIYDAALRAGEPNRAELGADCGITRGRGALLRDSWTR